MSVTVQDIIAKPFELLEQCAEIASTNEFGWNSIDQAMRDAFGEGPLYQGWLAAVRAQLEQDGKTPVWGDAQPSRDMRRPMTRGDVVEIAERVCELLGSSQAPLAYDIGKLWRYEDGIWSDLGEDELVNAISDLAGCPVYKGEKNGEADYRSLKINSFAGALTAIRARPLRWDSGPGFFDDAPMGIAFADCFVEVCIAPPSRGLLTHDVGPEHLARRAFDFAYDPGAKAPRFLEYLEQVWGHEEDCEARVKVLQEFAGAALVGLAPRYMRAMILKGEPGTGKSTFIHILESLFPDGSVCHVGPADFANDDKFGMLIGAKLNTLTEASAIILNQDRVKSALEGEHQTVVRKWEKAARFKPEAGHIFAMNEWAQIPGVHAAFWDRMMPLDLTKRIRDTNAEVRGLSELIAREERAGLVAWALEGARRLLEQDGYTPCPTCERLMSEWKSQADSVGAWIDERGETINSGPYNPLARLYEHYTTWCKDAGLEPVNRIKLGHRLKNHGVRKKKPGNVAHYQLTIRVA